MVDPASVNLISQASPPHLCSEILGDGVLRLPKGGEIPCRYDLQIFTHGPGRFSLNGTIRAGNDEVLIVAAAEYCALGISGGAIFSVRAIRMDRARCEVRVLSVAEFESELFQTGFSGISP